MANEYLKRTPTSTGNRKVFTWSGWVKRNTITGSYVLFSAGIQGDFVPGGNGFQITFDYDEIQLKGGNTGTDRVNTASLYRDVGSWFHLMFHIDTTKSVETERYKLYINGCKYTGSYDSATPNWPSLNFEYSTNFQVKPHTISANSGDPGAYLNCQLTDVFFVDGQALTPEVFGYNKDGNGYISAGSTQSTDFRNGQWVPKKPKLIIDEINASGGFGVNGFYLPMNSSNNFGADFHTTPNTILKLKENLPQPKAEIDGSGDYSGDIRDDLGGLPFPGVVKFDGDGDYLDVTPDSNFAYGTEDFTIECWVYFQTKSFDNYVVFDQRDIGVSSQSAPHIWFDRTFKGYRYYVNGLNVIAGYNDVDFDTWHHFALVKYNNITKIYVNGTQVGGSYSDTINYVESSSFRIGHNTNNSADMQGYISNFRIIKGTALYTENFIPPTQPLQKTTDTVLLCCNSKTDATNEETGKTITKNGDVYATTSELTDALVLAIPGVSGGLQNGFGDYSAAIRGYGSAKTIAVTNLNLENTASYYGSAIKIDGPTNGASTATGYMVVPSSSDFQFGTGDFTIETWVYGLDWTGGSANQDQVIYYHNEATSGFFLQGGSLKYYNASGGVLINGPTLVDQQWYHLSVVRNSVILTLYVNGVAVGVANDTDDYGTSAITIGKNSGNNLNQFRGYIQDFRIYKGVAKYKGGFDVPKPYTPVNFANWRAVPDTCQNNFATLNPLVSNYVLNNGNLSAADTNGLWDTCPSTIGVSSGKWYAEMRIDIKGWIFLGVTQIYGSVGINPLSQHVGTGANGKGIGLVYDPSDTRGDLTYNGVNSAYTSGSSGSSAGDIIAIGIDLDNNKVLFYRNGVEIYNLDNLLEIGAEYFIGTSIYQTSKGTFNFGQNPTFSGSNGKYAFNNAKIYSVYSASARSANYSVQYSDDNVNWTTAWSGVAANNNSCGIQQNTGGGGNYGAHRYWRYIEGSAITLHHPRVSRIILSDGVNDVDIITYSIDNCSDIGGYIIGTATYDGNPSVEFYKDSSGKGLFKYQPPEGFLALCEDNLPTPAIKNPGEHFKTVLYSGSDNSHKIDCGFKPDFIWIKERTSTSSNQLMDSVRGVDYVLYSNSTNVEFSRITQAGSTFSVTDTGFSIDNDTGINDAGQTYVAWCWKAGGEAVTNTDGTITSQVSANQTAGFSIVSWTGTGSSGTIGHSLNKIPKFIITKNRDSAISWVAYHNYTGSGIKFELNATTASASTNAWNSTEPTSNVFSIGNTSAGATNGEKYIAYCWAEIEGFSKFGSYVGNGSTDGPFVYCGFKPAFVMVKNTDTNSLWLMADNARFSTNPIDSYLHAESSDDEYGPLNGDSAYTWIDFLSNGFKLRQIGVSLNGSGDTYIFAAFAESPFQYANSK